VTVFVPGSTAGITTIEFENGALSDLKQAIERLVPRTLHYNHDARWGDGKGFAHVRAALVGPSLTVPVVGGRMQLGTWQQIILIDFDNRPREREVVAQVVGGC
jgi:secondary thiamine-phosphate synthase enzyme